MATSRLSGGALSTPIGSTEPRPVPEEDVHTVSSVKVTHHSFGREQMRQLLSPPYFPGRMTISEIEQLEPAAMPAKSYEILAGRHVSPTDGFQMVDGHLSSPTDQAADTHASSVVGRPSGSPAVVQPMVQQRRTLDISSVRALIGRVRETGEEVYGNTATAACLTATCSYPGAQEPERRI